MHFNTLAVQVHSACLAVCCKGTMFHQISSVKKKKSPNIIRLWEKRWISTTVLNLSPVALVDAGKHPQRCTSNEFNRAGRDKQSSGMWFLSTAITNLTWGSSAIIPHDLYKYSCLVSGRMDWVQRGSCSRTVSNTVALIKISAQIIILLLIWAFLMHPPAQWTQKTKPCLLQQATRQEPKSISAPKRTYFTVKLWREQRSYISHICMFL